MANRVIFQDPIYQYPNRYRLTDLGGGLYQIQSDPGAITQEGTLLSASNLNATAEEVIFHVIDTSDNANVFLCTINNLTAYYNGLSIILKAKTTNTGTATINISNVGAINVKKVDGNGNKINLEQNDIIKNKYELLTYDGTDFVLSNPAADIATLITDLNNLTVKVNTLQSDINNVKNKVTYFGTTTGLNNAYALNISGITSYYAGLIINMVANFSNTAAATLNINSLGAKPIKFNGNNLNSNDIQLNKLHNLIYNGVNFELQPTAAIIDKKEVGEINTIEIQDYFTSLADSVDGYLSINLEGNTIQNPNNLSDIKSIDSCVIKSVGKNLFNGEWIQKSLNVSTGYIGTYDSKYAITDYIRIKSNANYTEQTKGTLINNSSKYVVFYDYNKNYINSISLNIATATNTFRTPPNASFLIYRYYQTDTGIVTNNILLQLEEGITATNYEPYTEDKIDISDSISGDKSIKRLPNEVADTIDKTGVLTRKIGKRAYQSGDENNSNVITDKVNTYYELSTPSIEQVPPLYLQSFTNGSLIVDTPIPPKGKVNYPTNTAGAVSEISNAIKYKIRNIILSPNDADINLMNNGDIWIQYE